MYQAVAYCPVHLFFYFRQQQLSLKFSFLSLLMHSLPLAIMCFLSPLHLFFLLPIVSLHCLLHPVERSLPPPPCSPPPTSVLIILPPLLLQILSPLLSLPSLVQVAPACSKCTSNQDLNIVLGSYQAIAADKREVNLMARNEMYQSYRTVSELPPC